MPHKVLGTMPCILKAVGSFNYDSVAYYFVIIIIIIITLA